MNAWERFLIREIINGGSYPKEILDPLIDLYLTRYRRNQYESVPKLIFEARQNLERTMQAKYQNTNNNLYVKLEG